MPVSGGNVGLSGGTTGYLVGVVPVARMLMVDALKPARRAGGCGV